MGGFGTNLHDEESESEPEESVPGGVDGTHNSSTEKNLGAGCFGTFDKCVLPNIAVRRGWKKTKQGVIDFNTIKAATHNFSHDNKLGMGGFGSVFKGVLPNGTSIAVKLSEKSELQIREFENEIATISDLQHPHIVRLLGYCAQDNQLLLVYEYMENNSLEHALFEELRMRLNWPTRVKICVGIAKGLAFLHEESLKRIIHKDIKTTNILLDKNLNPKISDFRLATPTPSDKHYDDPIIGTFGYMAPEYFIYGRLSKKVDVYSFGAVTLQIVSGQKLFAGERDREAYFLLDLACKLQEEGNLVALVDPTLGSDYCQKEAVAILELALMCSNPSKSLRPKMSEVVKILEGNSDIRTLKSHLKMGKGILVHPQSPQSAGSTSPEEASDASLSRSVSTEEIAETSNLLDDDDGTHSDKDMTKATKQDSQGSKENVACDSSKITSIFSSIDWNDDIVRIISLYHIPPTIMCRRAEGQWATEGDHDLVPSRWDTILRTKLAPPTLYAEQESRLQLVRDHSLKEFSTIMSTSGRPKVSPGRKMKGSTVDRAMVKALYASRMTSSPPSCKRAKSVAHSASRPRSVGQVVSRETGPGDVPTPCPVVTPSHSKASPSTDVGIGAPMRSPMRIGAPYSCSTYSNGSVSMLEDVNLAKERLWGFMSATEIQEVKSQGPKGIIDTAMEGFAMVAATFPYLFSRTIKLEEAFKDLAIERQTRGAVEEQLRLERQTRGAIEEQLRLERQARGAIEEQLGLERQARETVEEQLRLAHERTVPLETDLLATRERVAQLEADRKAVNMRAETELRASCERAAGAEAELQIARERTVVVEADLRATLERAIRAEVHSVEMENKRDVAERAVAVAFIDGYEELKGKISTTFPTYDFSSFVPYEAPGTDDEEEIFDESGLGSNE